MSNIVTASKVRGAENDVEGLFPRARVVPRTGGRSGNSWRQGSYYFGHPVLRQKRVWGPHQRHSDLLQGETWHDMTWHGMAWHDMTWHDMTYSLSWGWATSPTWTPWCPRWGLQWRRARATRRARWRTPDIITLQCTYYITITLPLHTDYITGGGHGELLHLALHLLLPGQVSTSMVIRNAPFNLNVIFQLKGARTLAPPDRTS